VFLTCCIDASTCCAVAQIPDGVLITGDVTNAKTGYLERVLHVRAGGQSGSISS
jgi:hypothetical protein